MEVFLSFFKSPTTTTDAREYSRLGFQSRSFIDDIPLRFAKLAH